MNESQSILERVDEFPRFRSLTLSDGRIYREFIHKISIRSSELTFGGLFLWDAAHPVKLSKYDSLLLVLREDGEGGAEFIVPIGEGDRSEVFRVLLDEFPIEEFTRLPEQCVEGLSSQFIVNEDRDNFDYVYRVEDLANLEGRKYDGKRNWVKRCVDKYSPTYEPIGPGNLEECFSLATGWCNIRGCETSPPLSAEFRAIRRGFEQFRNLDLIGGAIRIDGQIEAFSIAERLDESTAVVHFEKANPEIEGLYQVINQWFCQNALSDFTWVNREQDLGISGLRKAKMGYHPEHFVKKYRLIEKDH